MRLTSSDGWRSVALNERLTLNRLLLFSASRNAELRSSGEVPMRGHFEERVDSGSLALLIIEFPSQAYAAVTVLLNSLYALNLGFIALPGGRIQRCLACALSTLRRLIIGLKPWKFADSETTWKFRRSALAA